MHFTTVQSPEKVLVLYFFIFFFIDSAFTAVEKDAKKFYTKVYMKRGTICQSERTKRVNFLSMVKNGL